MSTSWWSRTTGLSATLLGALALSGAAEAEDAARGAELARIWCSECHIVGHQRVGSDVAPPFITLAREAKDDPERLHTFLIAPHPAMPDPRLSLSEIQDLVAYLERLAEEAR